MLTKNTKISLRENAQVKWLINFLIKAFLFSASIHSLPEGTYLIFAVDDDDMES